jgi:hypothetical protein
MVQEKVIYLLILKKTLEEKKAYLDDKLVPQRIILISSTANSDSNAIFK